MTLFTCANCRAVYSLDPDDDGAPPRCQIITCSRYGLECEPYPLPPAV